jgi:hypothetical protein
MFKFIDEELQETYLPDFLDHDSFMFVEKLAMLEARIDELKKNEQEADDEIPMSVRRNDGPSLPMDLDDQESRAKDPHDFLNREREEILDQMRSSRMGFSLDKKKINEDIMKRVVFNYKVRQYDQRG